MLTPLLRVLPVGRASSQMLYDPSVDPLWPEIKVRCRLQVLRRSPLLACVGMRSGHPLPTPAHSNTMGDHGGLSGAHVLRGPH